MTLIKAGSITNLTDARYFAAFGAEYIGFCFDEDDKQYIKPEQALEIKGWLHEPSIVGEFNGQSISEIQLLNASFNFSYIQLSEQYKIDDWKKIDLPKIIEVPVNENTTFSNLKSNLKRIGEHADLILLNFRKFGVQWKSVKRPKTLSIEGLKQAIEGHKVIFDIALSAADVSEIVEEMPMYGLNVVGSHEVEVGLKNFENIDAVMKILKPEV